MLIALIIGGLVVLLLWRGWGKPVLTQGQWRIGSGLMSAGLIAGGALVAARGGYAKGLAVLAVGGVFALLTRLPPRNLFKPKPKSDLGPATQAPALSAADARAMLGVGAEATRTEITAAYQRLMQMAHPDKGGTSGLAAQLNAARDVLLKK